VTTSSAAIERTLAPHGFVRHGRTWYRERGELVDVVGAQIATTAGHEMTLNVGVFDRAVHAIVWGEPAPEFPAEEHCALRVRVGKLIDGRDIWWPPKAAETPDALARVLDGHVLPYFDRVETREGLIARVEAGRGTSVARLQLAALKHLAGDTAAAARVLDDLEAELPGWSERVDAVRRRLD
jgi:hypothetical protein